jgi:hypothetical protein
MEKKPLPLCEYWTQHYEYNGNAAGLLQRLPQFGKTIRRAMDAGQHSAVILRLQVMRDVKHQFKREESPLCSPRVGNVFTKQDLGSDDQDLHLEWKLDVSLALLIDWITNEQGLKWKLGNAPKFVSRATQKPVLESWFDLIVYWLPSYPVALPIRGPLWVYWENTCCAKCMDLSKSRTRKKR